MGWKRLRRDHVSDRMASDESLTRLIELQQFKASNFIFWQIPPRLTTPPGGVSICLL